MNSTNRFIELVDAPIDLASLQSKIADPDVGAHGWFCGVTRRRTATAEKTKTTQSLSYEAHSKMALAELEKISDAAIDQFGLNKVVIVHRLGEVPIGESSVVVGCSSAHRQATFDALQWIMKRLKQDVPIWKQETYADGSSEWVHPIEPADKLGTGRTNADKMGGE